MTNYVILLVIVELTVRLRKIIQQTMFVLLVPNGKLTEMFHFPVAVMSL